MRIVSDTSFREASACFGSSGQRPPVVPELQALLFSIVRTLKPNHVVEIGQFHRALTAAMGEALWLNGSGVLHLLPGRDRSGTGTVEKLSPGAEHMIRSYAADALKFFDTMNGNDVVPELVIINDAGDFGMPFVLERSSQSVASAGLILVRDPQRPDIPQALARFVSERPQWQRNALLAPQSGEGGARLATCLRSSVPNTPSFLFRSSALLEPLLNNQARRPVLESNCSAEKTKLALGMNSIYNVARPGPWKGLHSQKNEHVSEPGKRS